MYESPHLNKIVGYGINKIVTKTFAAGDAEIQMADHERVCYASGATIAGTVFLPPVALCAGEFVYVNAVSVATGNVTVKPWEDASNNPECAIQNGSGAQTSQALASAAAFTLLYSTGKQWLAVFFDLSI